MKTTKAHPFNFHRSAIAALAACVMPIAASAGTVHGSTDAAIVWVSAPDAIPNAPEAQMRNHYRTFQPPYIVIPVGGTIRFPNDDPFYHSIYSNSTADPFDIGYYGPGPGKVVTFSKPGVIDVHCHIHAAMHANIIVADGPYTVASGGTYTLANVPAGNHALHAWDPVHGERTMNVTVPAASADVTLDVRR